MSVSAEQALRSSLHEATRQRARLREREREEREATIRFMDEALHNHWSWSKVGEALGVTDTAARRYYQRNRRKVRVPGE